MRYERWAVVSQGSASDRWTWSGIPGGLAAGLSEHGAEVVRLTADLAPPREPLGRAIARRIPGQSMTGSSAGWLTAARDLRLRRTLGLADPDIVLAMGSSFGLRLSSATPIVTFEDLTVAQSPYPESVAKQRWIARQRRMYERAARCCVSTPWVAESIHKDYGIPEAKIAVVGLGANVVCRPTAKDWTRPRLLWVGVDWERKGGDLLLEAFQRAAIPNATLDLVGRHPDVRVPGVTGHGIVRDLDRMRSLFEAATLFVLPSRFDASPIVFFEAASAGTPCIGTRTAGAPYNIGPSGEVVPPGDVLSLTEAIIRLTDPFTAAQFGAAAVGHAKLHTWRAVAGRVIKAVEALEQSALLPVDRPSGHPRN